VALKRLSEVPYRKPFGGTLPAVQLAATKLPMSIATKFGLASQVHDLSSKQVSQHGRNLADYAVGRTGNHTAHRAATAVTILSLFGVSFATWSTVVQVPATGVISMVGFAGALALLVMTMATVPSRLRHVDLAVMVLGLALLAGWAISTVYAQPSYGTDEAAFEQYSASLLLHGQNPYGANLTQALTEFRVPIQYATYLLGGGIAHTLSYPAFPVLVVALFIPLTGGVQSVIIADVVALGATCVLTYLLLPGTWKSMATLVTIGLPILFGYSVSGVNAVLLGVPLVVVAWRWADTGRNGSLGASGTLRAACLGLAAATQQLAWFIAPFVLAGIWRLLRSHLDRSEARRVLVTFCGIALATFSVINLPFIIWAPEAWMTGVLAPLTQHAIPYGQGLIGASLFFHLGGGALRFYTFAGLLTYFALLTCYTAFFNKLGRACFVLPVMALYLTTRSLAEYFMTLVAVWAVSLLTTDAEMFGSVFAAPWLKKRLRIKLALVFSPALLLTGLALAVPAPLRVSVLSVATNGELEGVWQMTVRVVNTTGEPLSPEFQANYFGQATTFLHRVQGPITLAPHQKSIYRLSAPNRGSMPGIVAPFVVVASTAHPETVSVSPRFIPQPYSADLEPGYVNEIVPQHASVVFHVYLRSPFGAFVHKGGVLIALGQVIYGQGALLYAEGSINGAPEGQTPVYARTDAHGVATFIVRDVQPQGQPLYLQAWVADRYPYGYSDIVPVSWDN
jgi:uncharacterized membrane protein